ncbi:MAG: GNAT family protein [Bacteroidota bacterium]|nr:GNAT family protein [Bacteroidota bacterium]
MRTKGMIQILRPAYAYIGALQLKRTAIAFDPRYMYYECGVYCDYEISIEKSSWNTIQLVSIDDNNNLIGYFSASINRQTYNISALGAINFCPKPNLIFCKDMKQFFTDLFIKFNFNKISWRVVVGNPAEEIYDRLIQAYGGRIVGTFKNEIKLWDGNLYDEKHYEILKDEFRIHN